MVDGEEEETHIEHGRAAGRRQIILKIIETKDQEGMSAYVIRLI